MNNTLNELRKILYKINKEGINDAYLSDIKPQSNFDRGYLACLKGFVNFLKKLTEFEDKDLFYYLINNLEKNNISIKIKELDDEWIKGYKTAVLDIIDYLKKVNPKESSTNSEENNPR